MKSKSTKLIVLLLAAAMLVTLLAACGGGGGNSVAGTYKGLYCKWVGDDEQINEEFSLVLKSNGKGTHHRDDFDFDITWKLDGEKFTMTETFLGIELDYTGTLKDGHLELYNGDPSDNFTYMYVYEKQ